MNLRQTAGVAASLFLTYSLATMAGAQTVVHSSSALTKQVAAAAKPDAGPHALRALNDLLSARWMLANNKDEQVTDPNEDQALRKTNLAIAEFRNNLQIAGNDSAPPDVVRGRDDRLHAALRYLNAAYTDTKAVEVTNAWRTRAENDIWNALHYTQLALAKDTRADVGQCRALRKAYADLSTTREDLSETLRAFGNTRGDAYNDTLRIYNQTNSTLGDLRQSVTRQCGSVN